MGGRRNLVSPNQNPIPGFAGLGAKGILTREGDMMPKVMSQGVGMAEATIWNLEKLEEMSTVRLL